MGWLRINGNWYWGSFAEEYYVMESCNGLEIVRGRLLDAGNSGYKVTGGGNDLIGGCDDRYGVLVRCSPSVPSMMAQMQQ